MKMLEDGLASSDSDWHFIVTHFPGPSITAQVVPQHEKYGIDLVFTGHSHFQTLGEANGMLWIISGGGGGATTDADECATCNGYGFINFWITATEMNLELVNHAGHIG